MLYLCIVEKGDVPVFEIELSSSSKKEDLNQFIIHAALDLVEQRIWETSAMFLGQVDRFNELSISAFVTAGYTKLMLLHDPKYDESSIGSFLSDVYELYIKVILNPFHQRLQRIVSSAFTARVLALGQKHLQK